MRRDGETMREMKLTTVLAVQSVEVSSFGVEMEVTLHPMGAVQDTSPRFRIHFDREWLEPHITDLIDQAAKVATQQIEREDKRSDPMGNPRAREVPQ